MTTLPHVDFACPACGAVLGSDGVAYTCPACGAVYPVRGGIVRFVEDDQYTAPFGFEWGVHRRTQLDSSSGTTRSRDTFLAKTRIEPAELAGSLVLDVGVGSGRFAEVAADMGARVVGMDLSAAVESAHANLGDRATIVQGDLFHPPFAPGTFDIVYSIGVLHHTPDTRAAVAAIAPLVRPGGLLAVWVYERAIWYRVADLYRLATTRMSHDALYRLSARAARLDPILRLPIIGRPLRLLLPISHQRDLEWRVLDTFDWYAPRYQWKHDEAEVAGWLTDLGFGELRYGAPGVGVTGRATLLPANASADAATASTDR